MAEVMKELTPLEKSLANEQEHTLELFEQVPQRVDWMRSQIMKPGALLESDFMSGLKALKGFSRQKQMGNNSQAGWLRRHAFGSLKRS